MSDVLIAIVGAAVIPPAVMLVVMTMTRADECLRPGRPRRRYVRSKTGNTFIPTTIEAIEAPTKVAKIPAAKVIKE